MTRTPPPGKRKSRKKTMKRKWGKICKANRLVQTKKIMYTNYKSYYFLKKNLNLTQ